MNVLYSRVWFFIGFVLTTVSCERHVRTERLMTWAEERHTGGMPLPSGGRIIVLRFVDDPHQGIFEAWSADLQARLTRLGNPVRVTFDCWRQLGGTFGFDIVGLGGEPYVPAGTGGPSPSGAFSEGPSRPSPLESAVP